MAPLEKSIGQAARSPLLLPQPFVRRHKYASKNVSVIGDAAMSALLSLAWLRTSEAQLLPITTRVITINNLAVAALRHPTNPGPKAKIGIFIMHPDGSYVNNVACTQLAGRGYTTLCADSIFLRRGQDYYGYEQHAPESQPEVNFLETPAPWTVLLSRNSSSGATASGHR